MGRSHTGSSGPALGASWISYQSRSVPRSSSTSARSIVPSRSRTSPTRSGLTTAMTHLQRTRGGRARPLCAEQVGTACSAEDRPTEFVVKPETWTFGPSDRQPSRTPSPAGSPSARRIGGTHAREGGDGTAGRPSNVADVRDPIGGAVDADDCPARTSTRLGHRAGKARGFGRRGASTGERADRKNLAHPHGHGASEGACDGREGPAHPEGREVLRPGGGGSGLGDVGPTLGTVTRTRDPLGWTLLACCALWGDGGKEVQ